MRPKSVDAKTSLTAAIFDAAKKRYTDVGHIITAQSQLLGLISYTHQPLSDDPAYLGEWGDVIFGQLGDPLDIRTHSLWDTNIVTSRGQYPHFHVNMHEWHRPLNKASLEFGMAAEPITNSQQIRRPVDYVAHARYSDGKLEALLLGSPWGHLSDKRVPVISVFFHSANNQPQIDSMALVGEPTQSKRISDEHMLVNFPGREVWDCYFEIVDGRMILTQKCDQLGVQRKIIVPQKVNMDRVVAAAYSKPMTAQDAFNPRYQPAWLNMQKVIGAEFVTT